MASYTELYEAQDYVNKEANSASYDLPRATAVLNTERESLTREEEARLQGVIGAQDISTLTAQSFDAAMAKLSGDQDLMRWRDRSSPTPGTASIS